MCTVIQSTGKFEGGPCITHLAYTWIMAGMGDREYSDPDEREFYEDECAFVDLIAGPFTTQDIDAFQNDTNETLCNECKAALLRASALRYWEAYGCAYSELVD